MKSDNVSVGQLVSLIDKNTILVRNRYLSTCLWSFEIVEYKTQNRQEHHYSCIDCAGLEGKGNRPIVENTPNKILSDIKEGNILGLLYAT